MAKKKDKVLLPIADIDAQGIYQGVKFVAELQPGDVSVPSDCDLVKGGYTWNGNSFVPTLEFILKQRKGK